MVKQYKIFDYSCVYTTSLGLALGLIAMVTWAVVVIFSGKHVKNKFKKINNGEPGKGKSVDRRGNRYYDTFDSQYYEITTHLQCRLYTILSPFTLL